MTKCIRIGRGKKNRRCKMTKLRQKMIKTGQITMKASKVNTKECVMMPDVLKRDSWAHKKHKSHL